VGPPGIRLEMLNTHLRGRHHLPVIELRVSPVARACPLDSR